jgi:hypothetical protein
MDIANLRSVGDLAFANPRRHVPCPTLHLINLRHTAILFRKTKPAKVERVVPRCVGPTFAQVPAEPSGVITVDVPTYQAQQAMLLLSAVPMKRGRAIVVEAVAEGGELWKVGARLHVSS